MQFHSRKRLRPWLETMVVSGTFHGLEWFNENEKMFKIPWQRLGHPEWREEDNLIFKEWEMVTGRLTEGDEDNWSDWKTRLRCALTKNPEIQEMHEFHSKDKCNPYKVYKFLDTSPALKSEVSSELPVCSQFQCSQEARYNDLGKDNRHTNEIQDRFTGNVPTVVTEDGLYSISSTPNSTDAQEEYLVLANTDYEDCKMVMPDICMNVLLAHEDQFSMQTSLSPHPKNDSRNHPRNDLSLNIKPELYQGAGNQLVPGSVMLPSDLESLEVDDLFQKSEVEMASSLGSFSSLKTSLEVEAGAASIKPTKGVLQVKIFYLREKIADAIVGADGCRVFYHTSRETFHDTVVQEDMFGPKTVQEIELPDVGAHVGKEKTKLINNLLERMDRGIILQVVDGDIYAKRLCGTRVFVSDGSSISKVLDRKNKASIKIFDFNERFKSAVQASAGSKNYRHLQPYVYLTFGQEIKIGQPSPMDRVLVHMQIIHVRAAELLSEMPEIREDTQELQMSSFDSMDRILHAFKAISIKP